MAAGFYVLASINAGDLVVADAEDRLHVVETYIGVDDEVTGEVAAVVRGQLAVDDRLDQALQAFFACYTLLV